MLYFIHGENLEKARVKARELVNSLRRKKPDASYTTIDTETFSPEKLSEFAGSQGLFERKLVVFADNILANKDWKELILEKIGEIAKSPNIFVFLEGKLDKATLEKIKKNAVKVQEFAKTESADRKFALEGGRNFSLKDFDIFNMADALGKRDKKTLWTLYIKSVRANIPAEEVSGVLFWQIKNMVLARGAESAAETGLKPFVFFKAKNYARNYSENELINLSSKMVSIYHNSHRGLCNFEIALEKFILDL